MVRDPGPDLQNIYEERKAVVPILNRNIVRDSVRKLVYKIHGFACCELLSYVDLAIN